MPATDKRPVVLLLGKIPPPYMGPAVATRHILDSRLNDHFRLIHQDTRLNRELTGLGRWTWRKPFRQLTILAGLNWKILRYRPKLVWIPISQATGGFLKDSLYLLVSRMMGRKVLVHLRGSDFRNWLDRSPKWLNRYVAFVLRCCAGVIVLGECLRHLFEGFFPPERIFVVPNGADFSFPPRQHSDHTVRVLYLANLMASKGIEDVVSAVALLKERGISGFHMGVVGSWVEPDLRVRVINTVHSQGLPVSFHPPATGEAKARIFSDADVFVFTPRAPEGHPWVIVEALAAGLPIVATDKGAIPESVVHAENGLLVEAKNPNQIAHALETLLTNKTLRESMGEQSLKKYQSNFTEKAMVNRLFRVLSSLCE